MPYITAHSNTVVFDIGTKITKIGYVGDFHPTLVFKSSFQNLSIAEVYCKTIEKYAKKLDVDSVIIIEPDNFSAETKTKILKFLFANKVVNSVLFLNNRIAEAFGAGKVSGIVWAYSNSTLGVFVIINGKIVDSFISKNGYEKHKNEVKELFENDSRKDEILLELKNFCLSEDQDEIIQSMFESKECINSVKMRFGIDFLSVVEEDFKECADQIAVFRHKYSIQKKNTANGCILLTGGLFRFDIFHELGKSLLLSKIGVDFNDFVLRDKELINSFVGASVFGSNLQTKSMFISSYDWQKIGSEIIKFKGFY